MTLQDLKQIRMNAKVGRILHTRRLARLNRISFWIDSLITCIPILWMAFRYLGKDTENHDFIEHYWEIAAAILACLGIIKIILGVSEKTTRHSVLIGENIAIADKAENYINSFPTVNPSVLTAFRELDASITRQDTEILGLPSERARRSAYRAALKELGIDAYCPACKTKVWDFKPGSCQHCGGRRSNDKEGFLRCLLYRLKM